MSRSYSRRLRFAVLIGALAIALPATVPEPADAFNPRQAIRWFGHRVRQPVRWVGDRVGDVLQVGRLAVKGSVAVVRTVDRGTHKLADATYRIVDPLVPRPLKRPVRQLAHVKAQLLTQAVKGLRPLTRIDRRIQKVERIQRRTDEVRRKAEQYAARVSKLGERGREATLNFVAVALKEKWVTPGQAAELMREAKGFDAFTKQLSGGLTEISKQITPPKIGRVLVREVLPAGLRALRDLGRSLGGKRRRPRREPAQERPAPKGIQVLAKEALDTGKQVALDSVLTGLRQNFRAELHEKGDAFLKKWLVSRTLRQIDPEGRQRLTDLYRKATGLERLTREQQFTLGAVEMLRKGDREGAMRAMGRAPPNLDPKVRDTLLAMIKGAFKKTKEQLRENARESLLKVLEKKSGARWKALIERYRKAKKDPAERKKLKKEILAMVGKTLTELRARFTAGPTKGEAPLSVSFDAGRSKGLIKSYEWVFGDGESDSGRTASHIFQAPDEYTVKLTVTSKLGQTHTATQKIIALPDLDASIAVEVGVQPNPVAPGDPIAITAAVVVKGIPEGTLTVDFLVDGKRAAPSKKEVGELDYDLEYRVKFPVPPNMTEGEHTVTVTADLPLDEAHRKALKKKSLTGGGTASFTVERPKKEEEPEDKPPKLDFVGTWKCQGRFQSWIDSEGEPLEAEPVLLYITVRTTATITRQGSRYRVSGLTDAKITSTRVKGDTLVMEGISDPLMGEGSDRERITLTLKEEGRVLDGTQQTTDYTGNVGTASIHCRR
jgi:PKD repeat protein